MSNNKLAAVLNIHIVFKSTFMMKLFFILFFSCFLGFTNMPSSHLQNRSGYFVCPKEEKNDSAVEPDTGNRYIGSVPDIVIELVSGDYVNLQDFVDHKKYVFIVVWTVQEKLMVNDLFAFDSIAQAYSNKLTVIGLIDGADRNLLNRLKKYNIKSIKGILPKEYMQQLLVKNYPYGMLFSKYGQLLHKEMNKAELLIYLKRHVTISRAKF